MAVCSFTSVSRISPCTQVWAIMFLGHVALSIVVPIHEAVRQSAESVRSAHLAVRARTAAQSTSSQLKGVPPSSSSNHVNGVMEALIGN
jgi:hypothetical protein